MKLNLDYYKQDCIWNPYQEEERIISNYLEGKEENPSVESTKVFSDIANNIIRWYPFKENSTILEIGAHLGEITLELCKKAEKVISIEFSKKRAEFIQKRYEKQENLELMIGSLKEIELQEKFDYITLFHVLEYAEELNRKPEEILRMAKSFLKPDGRILIVTDNKFGMRSFSNIQKNDKASRFQAVADSKNRLLTKNKLDSMIKQEEFEYGKYYYVLPDANFTNVIFTDKFLPNQDNMTRNITVFNDDELVYFHENNGYHNIIEDDPNMFPYFANTFFVEVGNTQEENEIRYVSYGNLRKPKYRIQTTIKRDKVYKQAIGDKSHFERMKKNIDYMNQLGIKTLDSYDKNQIISQYVENEKTLDKVLIEEYKQEEKEKVKESVNRFFQYLKEKLTQVDETNNVFEHYHIDTSNYPIEKLHFVKEGLWDLTFQNCFYIDNDFYFYDQEWFEENMPIEFMIYRNILYFHELKRYIKEEEWYNEFNILEFKELFQQLDNKLQEKIRDDGVWKLTSKPIQNIQAMLNEDNTLRHDLNRERQINEELRNVLQAKENELSAVYNSRGWKAITKVRKIVHR